MQIALDATARDWRDRALKFATEELIPFEVEAELHEGRLPPEVEKRHKKLAIELGFSAMDVPRSRGGRQARIVDQVAVWEQLGRVTNALCWCFSEAQSWMFEACTEEQIQQFILPLMSGERKECYAITESGSGSDVSVETTARRAKGGYSIDGEKWYVTSANHADYFILQARLVDGPHAGSDSLFFIETNSPASRSCGRRSSATLSARIIRPIASRTSSCPRASGSAPKATACASRTPGSGASGS